ncbi:AAA family ATPase [Pseudonocardia charpentierae]|uniref:Tetratricopeptide repeat-containing protein n=1 Tax=Pseudonocardia charpentierae TaxID=3075545 RepID=A0ABU2NI21_9PSEU|nr:hypothetical protein [Pseudonocardia sp. DSM 45834]MDT0353612.1 hypothetical protein [Pseudonocardia sp. DSM 45834]
MIESSSQPYQDFLRSADIARWRDCLDRTVRRLAALDVAEPEQRVRTLAEALCVTAYLSWLSRASGESAEAGNADQIYRQLIGDLVRRGSTNVSPELDLCWGIVLGYAGYAAMAEPLLRPDKRTMPAPEHLLLMMPGVAVRNAAFLHPHFVDLSPNVFLPLVHSYGDALAAIGAAAEARDLIYRVEPAVTHPLLIDVLGGVEERLGRWDEAAAVYRRSNWPVHRYRRALVAAIAGHGSMERHLEPDAPTIRRAGEFEPDFDQVEIGRSVAFLNACVWRPNRSWVVELELGKLSFGRRRNAEADLHYLRAGRSAPESAQYIIYWLRFCNYTWLAGASAHSALSMTPEALTAGREALARSSPEDNTAAIRIWIADGVDDHELIQADLSAWEPYDRAQAYEIVGAADLAVDEWIEALRYGYGPSLFRPLMLRLDRAGLRGCVDMLAEVVLQQSYDDFGGLLEITRNLSATSPTPASATGHAEEPIINRYVKRLVELGGQQFKSNVQTYAVLLSGDFLDTAEELLQRLTKQADGVSELLAVAVLRRASAQATQSRDEVLGCLRRAVTEARDRSERLQIARELFHWGEVSAARALLEQDRVFDPDQQLSHAEAIVAVQCTPWLMAEDQADVVDRAVRRLLDDPTIRLDARSYADRLTSAISEAQGMSAAADEAEKRLQEVRGHLQESRWQGKPSEGAAAIQRLQEQIDNVDPTPQPFDPTAVAGPGTSFGLRLAAVTEMRDGLRGWLNVARRVTIPAPRRSASAGGGLDRPENRRAIQLRDLWRARLVPESAADAAPDASAERAADVAFRVFFDEERQLRETRQRLLREAAVPSFQRALRYGQALRMLLPQLIGDREREEPHPLFRALFAAVARDVEGQISDLDEVLADIESELEPTDQAEAWHSDDE